MGNHYRKKADIWKTRCPASFVSRLAPLRRLAVCACRTPAF